MPLSPRELSDMIDFEESREDYERRCWEEGEVPCIAGRRSHSWVISDEDENHCYCEYCGCVEY